MKGKHTAGNDKGEQGDKDKAGNKRVCSYAGCGMKGHTDNECCKLKAVLEKYSNLKDKSNDSKPASSNTIVANCATTFQMITMTMQYIFSPHKYSPTHHFKS
jgi:hypothetical protein